MNMKGGQGEESQKDYAVLVLVLRLTDVSSKTGKKCIFCVFRLFLRAIADLFFTNYNGNIMGVARVYWRIYSLRVEQYIPWRLPPLDILHNPSGVYYPIYPCQAQYIITVLS